MPRRGRIAKRDVLADPVYNSKLVTRLVNSVMLDGKKGVAQKIVYGAFDIVAEKTGKDALDAFTEALENIMPVLEVKSPSCRRRYLPGPDGGPSRKKTDPGPEMAHHLCKIPSEKTMKERLAGEIMDALNNTGGACKKRDDTHKMAEANKAFAHFRW